MMNWLSSPDVSGKSDIGSLNEAYRTRDTEVKNRIANSDLDEVTKKELYDLGKAGWHFDTLGPEVDRAIAGEGKYASRRANTKALQLFNDRPGAAQLFNYAATRADAQRGMLTGQTAGLIQRKV